MEKTLRRLSFLVRRETLDKATAEGRSGERYRRIALSVATGSLARLVSTAISLLTVPLLLSYLGKEQFGLWSTLLSASAWLGLCDLGITSGLVNVMAEAHGREDRPMAARVFSTAVTVLIVIGMIVGVAFLVLFPWISWDAVFAARGTIGATTVRWSVAALVGGFIVGLPLLTAASIYTGYQRSYVTHLFAAAAACASLAAIGAAISLGASLAGLVAWMSAAGVMIAVITLVVLTKWHMPWLALRARHVRMDAWRRLRRSAAPLWAFQAGALMVNQSQLVVLAHTNGLHAAAEYSILLRLLQIYTGIMLLMTSAFGPPYREAFERGDHTWVRRGFALMVRLRVGLAAGFAALFLAFGNPLLRMWLQRSDVSFAPAVWAAFGLLLLSSAWVSAHSDLLIVLDRIWIQVGLVLVNGIATVLLTLWLAPMLGVLGVVIAIAALTTIAFTWLMPLLTRPVLATSRL